MPNGYLIGEQFAHAIKQTIAKVEGTPYGGEVTKIPTDLGGDTAYVPKTFRMCTFTGAWAINSDKVCTFLGVTSTPNTVSVTNLFFDLPNDGSSTCAIAKNGTAWYLVQEVHTSVDVITNVTLTTAGLQFTRTKINVVCTATASNVSIGTTACS